MPHSRHKRDAEDASHDERPTELLTRYTQKNVVAAGPSISSLVPPSRPTLPSNTNPKNYLRDEVVEEDRSRVPHSIQVVENNVARTVQP